MTNMPLSISVVIPTYNRAHLLERAIDSALDQINSAIDEVIVVDDGSVDDTRKVLEKYDGRVSAVYGKNRGAGAARNLGIEMATRDLVAFLDSDDEWMPGKLAAQRTLMVNRKDVLFAFGNMACTWVDGTIVRRYLWNWHKDSRPWSEIVASNESFTRIGELPKGWNDFRVYTGDLYADLAHRLYVLTSSCIVRREAAGSALVFDEDIPMYEDWGCFARLARVGPAAYMDVELTWQHGHVGTRLTGANELVHADSRLTILRRIWGTDDAYQDFNAPSFDALIDEQLLKKAKTLLKSCKQRRAREVLREMSCPPFSIRMLSFLPTFAVRSVLGLRQLARTSLRLIRSSQA